MKRARIDRFARAKGADARHSGDEPRSQDQAGAERSKGRCGAKAPDRWKASRIGVQRNNVHALAQGPILALIEDCVGAQAPRVPIERRQRCQRHGPHAPQREDNARGGKSVCDPPKRIVLS